MVEAAAQRRRIFAGVAWLPGASTQDHDKSQGPKAYVSDDVRLVFCCTPRSCWKASRKAINNLRELYPTNLWSSAAFGHPSMPSWSHISSKTGRGTLVFWASSRNSVAACSQCQNGWGAWWRA